VGKALRERPLSQRIAEGDEFALLQLLWKNASAAIKLTCRSGGDGEPLSRCRRLEVQFLQVTPNIGVIGKLREKQHFSPEELYSPIFCWSFPSHAWHASFSGAARSVNQEDWPEGFLLFEPANARE